jgi:hypothetical protein
VKSFALPHPIIVGKIFLADDILTVIYILNTGDESMLVNINIHTGQILNELSSQIPNRDRNIFYNSRNIRDIFDITTSDTLYHIHTYPYSIKPVFVMFDNLTEEQIKIHYQLNHFVVLSIVWGKDARDIKRVAVTDMKNNRASWVNMKNDFFGNLDVRIMKNTSYNFCNGYFVDNIQPEQLMEEIEQRLTESDCTEKDRQILLKTLSSLQEGANNVVFIGRLKDVLQTTLF